MLGVTSKDNNITNNADGYYIYDKESLYNRLFASKVSGSEGKANFNYSLSCAINSYLFEDKLASVYLLGGSNMLVTAGHLLGYRITGYEFECSIVTIEATTARDAQGVEYASYTYSTTSKTGTVSIISGSSCMGYVNIGGSNVSASAGL